MPGSDASPRVAFPKGVSRAVLLAALIGFALMFALGWRDSLLMEDGPLEWATAAVYAVAIAVGIWAMRTSRPATAVYWTLPGFALFGLLDELSFGSRLFGFTPPQYDGMTLDSLHDVFDVVDRMASDVGVRRLHLAAAFLLLLGIVVVVLSRKGRASALLRWLRDNPPVAYLGAAVVLLLAAVGLDVVGKGELSRFLEETFEFAGAGAVLLGTWTIVDSRSKTTEAVPI